LLAAQDAGGCSRRIGSVQKDSAVRAVARGGTRRFATLHSACHRAITLLEPRGKGYRMLEIGTSGTVRGEGGNILTYSELGKSDRPAL
jgi:hypothetical protein